MSLAVQESSIEVVKLLIDWSSASKQSLRAGDLVWYAVHRYESEDHFDVLGMLHTLIDAGAPVDEVLWDRDPASQTKSMYLRGTPLHKACEKGFTEVAKLLIEHGARLDKRKSRNGKDEGETPREIAQRRRHSAILRMMNGHGN